MIATAATAAGAAQALNQPPEGFVALFNGKDLTGWKGLVGNPETRAKMSPAPLAEAQKKADESMREHWKVEDGALVFDGKGQALCTAKDYGDFEMFVDWKIPPKGDSGIYLRGTPQVQIWDSAGEGKVGSGGLYNNQKNPKDPLKVADKPAGEWNTFRIKMIGDKVSVWLNGELVTDNVTMENYWDRGKPIYPTGQIELQNHGAPLYFRNLYIREIARGGAAVSSAAASGAGAAEEAGGRPLFNGKDLTGWRPVPANATEKAWSVVDGVLTCTGKGGGWLSTTEEFADFDLKLKWRFPAPNGNSGVFLRHPGTGDGAYSGMEIQVLDDFGSEYNNLQPWQYTGSIYGVVPAAPGVPKKDPKWAERATKDTRDWQEMRIRCEGPLVKVWLNGKMVVDANLKEHVEQHLKQHPGIARSRGYIGLQNHSTGVEYKDILIRGIK
jgi:hypothetical protein